jgi:hypothetical protein
VVKYVSSELCPDHKYKIIADEVYDGITPNSLFLMKCAADVRTPFINLFRKRHVSNPIWNNGRSALSFVGCKATHISNGKN